ncbi:hypothetical protein GF312_04710 [Candidatus Poribacteria bacterium]|nr:hypothetical protein [Candidatus Poribacteria bacterium]
MKAVKDAYETTIGRVVVKDKNNVLWALKKAYQDNSLPHNKKLEVAIDMFKQDKIHAFEKYIDKIHGPLHA